MLKTHRLIDSILVGYLTMLDMSPFITGAAPPKLTLKKLKSVPISVPPSPSEQQKIADCLGSLNTSIAAHGQAIESLQTHKKGLMQQLFPLPEGD